MKKENKILWKNVERIAHAYAVTNNELEKKVLIKELFGEMKRYIGTCANNAVRNAKNYGLYIPKEDFESRIIQYIWEALETFNVDSGSTFKNIVIRRIRFAETHTWRQYKTKGNENDKDGVSYFSARWDSLDRTVEGGDSENRLFADILLDNSLSAEDEFFDRNEEINIVVEFAKINQRYASIIRFISLGYKGDALAKVTGEANSNNTKMRKLIQRSKDSFAKFMKERVS